MTDDTLRFVDILAEEGHPGRRKTDLRRFELTYKARITGVYPLTEDINLYRIRIIDPIERKGFRFRPGQFVMLEVPGIGEAPFSISSSTLMRGDFELCVQRAGNLTNFLAGIRRGIRVGIRGPFGTSFPVGKMHGGNVLLVAGGLGIVPLRAPLCYVLENRGCFKGVDVVYGARRPSDLLFTYLYEVWRESGINLIPVVESPDPSWRGEVGLITDVLRKICGGSGCSFRDTYAIVCGPPAMFKVVCEMLTSAGMPMQKMYVSLERRMHCGMGKCCRCNVGSTYICLEGPVMDYWSVMNLKEAI